MNTNKIYAEHIANEYSSKKESKVIALKKLDRKAKLPADIFVYSNGMRTSQRYNNLKKYVLIPILDRFGVKEEEKNYLLSFYVNGITAVIKEWIENGYHEPIDYIQNIIIKCVKDTV